MITSHARYIADLAQYEADPLARVIGDVVLDLQSGYTGRQILGVRGCVQLAEAVRRHHALDVLAELGQQMEGDDAADQQVQSAAANSGSAPERSVF